MTESIPPSICPLCRAEMPRDAPQGFCPRCLLELLSGQVNPKTQSHAVAESTSQPGLDAVPAAQKIRRFGDYELMGEIAEGGMGIVYFARQISLNRTVALKMIRSARLATAAEIHRFRTEAEAAATLDHPNIVPIYEIGEHDGQQYFSMKLVEGGTLADLNAASEDRGAAWQRRIAGLMARVAQAVHHAHQRAVLHRDLKPTNILLDEQGQPHLTDFGLAKVLEGRPDYTQSLAVLGTPGYMPPEQAAGRAKELTTAADTYSLGAILYELLVGRQVYPGESALEVLKHVQELEPLSPRKLNPAIAPDLETICLKCLQKTPERRYPSAQALAEDLERFLRGEPIQARPIGSGERLVRWCRRKPALAGSLGALGFALVFGLAGVTWQWRNAQRHAESEARHRQLAEDAVFRLTYEKAESLFEQDRAAQALAHLARLMRQHPANSLLAARLQSALTLRGFCLPVAQLQHQGRILCVSLSPDGRRVLSGSADKTARMWDARTGRLLFEIQHKGSVEVAAFGPTGRVFLTASRDGTACVWDTLEGHRIGQPMKHQASVQAAGFSPLGDRVVTGSFDNTVRVWDAATGQPLGDPMAHSNGLASVAFNSDASRIASVTTNGKVQIWNASTGARELTSSATIPGTTGRRAIFSPDDSQVLVAHVAFFDSHTAAPKRRIVEPGRERSNLWAEFSPDNKWLVTASQDFTARVWDWKTGRPESAPMHHDNFVLHASYSADGQSIVTASNDQSARVWDNQGNPLSEPLRHGAPVWDAQMNADSKRLVARLWTSNAWLWEIRKRSPSTPRFSHAGGLLSVRFSRDGQRLLTTGQDRTARLWDVRSGRPIFAPLTHGDWVDHAEFSPDERQILTASQDGAARLWDASTGQPEALVFRHTNRVFWAEFSPDGSRIATASDDYTAQVWDARTGQPVGPRLQHASWVFTIHFSPDGGRVVTSSLDSTARVWDAATGKSVTPPMKHEDTVHNAQFTPDGQRVITCSQDRTARVWDARTGKALLAPFEHPDGLARSSPHLSAAGRRAATAAGNVARVWDLTTGQPLPESLTHQAAISAARFNPDGTLIVTAAGDGTARIWDAATGFPISEPMMHGDRVTCAEFSPDGRWIVTGSEDHEARIWEVPIVSGNVPSWLADLAEAAGGLRFNSSNMLESVSPEQALQLRQRLAATKGNDPWSIWVSWYCADAAARAAWPAFQAAEK